MKCLFCNIDLPKNRKYCSNKCEQEYFYKQNIEKWFKGEITGSVKYRPSAWVKRYLLEKYDSKCSKCGWNEINKFTNRLPLEIEHIDGNAYNNTPENLLLLCPNCQSLTKTYRGANVGNGRRSYLKKYYLKTN